jgi:hypothetical protein
MDKQTYYGLVANAVVWGQHTITKGHYLWYGGPTKVKIIVSGSSISVGAGCIKFVCVKTKVVAGLPCICPK